MHSCFVDVAERLEERKRHMVDVCTKLGHYHILPGDVIYKKNKYLSKSLFYTDKWKVNGCECSQFLLEKIRGAQVGIERCLYET